MIRRLLRAALLVSPIFLTSILELSAQSTNNSSTTVIVTGVGKTKWNAQSDAIRQALERTTQQLVIADRAINDDDIVKDRVLSTLNGFVERFEILQERFEDGEYQLLSRVTVSPTKISNYIATGGKPGKSVEADGATLLAGVSEFKQKSAHNAALALRMLDGIFFTAITTRIIPPLKPNPSDATVIVTVGIRFDPDFLESLMQTGAALEKPQENFEPICQVNTQSIRTASSPCQTQAPPLGRRDGLIIVDRRGLGINSASRLVGIRVSPIDSNWVSKLEWPQTGLYGLIPVLFATEDRALIDDCSRVRDLYFPADLGLSPTSPSRANAIVISGAEIICEFTIPTNFFDGAKQISAEVTSLPERWHKRLPLQRPTAPTPYAGDFSYGFDIPPSIYFRCATWALDTGSTSRFGSQFGFTSFWRRGTAGRPSASLSESSEALRACEGLPLPKGRNLRTGKYLAGPLQ